MHGRLPNRPRVRSWPRRANKKAHRKGFCFVAGRLGNTAHILVRRPFGASFAAARLGCSLSAILPRASNPRVRTEPQRANRKAHRKGGPFCVLAGRPGYMARIFVRRPFGASSTAVRLGCSLSAILPKVSNPGVRTEPQRANKKAHRKGGLFCLLAGRLGFEHRLQHAISADFIQSRFWRTPRFTPR